MVSRILMLSDGRIFRGGRCPQRAWSAESMTRGEHDSRRAWSAESMVRGEHGPRRAWPAESMVRGERFPKRAVPKSVPFHHPGRLLPHQGYFITSGPRRQVPSASASTGCCFLVMLFVLARSPRICLRRCFCIRIREKEHYHRYSVAQGRGGKAGKISIFRIFSNEDDDRAVRWSRNGC